MTSPLTMTVCRPADRLGQYVRAFQVFSLTEPTEVSVLDFGGADVSVPVWCGIRRRLRARTRSSRALRAGIGSSSVCRRVADLEQRRTAGRRTGTLPDYFLPPARCVHGDASAITVNRHRHPDRRRPVTGGFTLVRARLGPGNPVRWCPAWGHTPFTLIPGGHETAPEPEQRAVSATESQPP